jgi:hypothetical protein
MRLVRSLDSDQDAALMTITLPNKKQITLVARRLGAYSITRGNANNGVFRTHSRGAEYLIVDNAAETNVVGVKNSKTLTLAPTSLPPIQLLGPGESRLSPISAGRLDVVFVATQERPAHSPNE